MTRFIVNAQQKKIGKSKNVACFRPSLPLTLTKLQLTSCKTESLFTTTCHQVSKDIVAYKSYQKKLCFSIGNYAGCIHFSHSDFPLFPPFCQFFFYSRLFSTSFLPSRGFLPRLNKGLISLPLNLQIFFIQAGVFSQPGALKRPRGEYRFRGIKL